MKMCREKLRWQAHSGFYENRSGREEVTPLSSKRGKLLHSDRDRLHLDEMSGCFTFAVRRGKISSTLITRK